MWVGLLVRMYVPIKVKPVGEVVSGNWDNTGARALICRNRVFGQWRWAIIFGDEAVDPWTWGMWNWGWSYSPAQKRCGRNIS